MNNQKNGKEIILNGGIKRIFAIIFMIIFVVCAILYANKKSIINNQSYLADAETLKTLTYGELNDEDIKVNNCANIEFSAFFVKDTNNDGYAEKYKGSCKPVNSTDELYINLNLLSGGRLENGKIEIKSSNFKYNLNMVKDSVLKYNYISENVKEIYLNNIDAGTQKLIIGNIKSYIGTDINNYSRADNAITLKGTYVLEDGTRIEINETRNLAVDWYGNVSTGINTTYVNFDYSTLKESNLNFQINVQEYNKTLLLQESGVKAIIPDLGGYAPKSIKCLNAEYNYNEETKELIITRTSTCSEEGIITNIISRDNIYNILIEYPEEAYDAVSEGTIISVPVEAYYKGYNNPSKEFSNPSISTNKREVSLILKTVPTGEVCNIFVDYQDKKVANKPYKRNVVSKQNIINAYNSENKENIQFNVKWTAIRGSEGNVNAVKISETKTDEKYGDVWGSTVMDEYISNTGLYFYNPTNMLGEVGKIFIYDNDTNELIETLTSKDWNKYSASNPYKYSAPIKHIRIETTNANLNSTLTIYCIKEIDIEKLTKDYTKEQIENIDYIATRVTGKFYIEDENNDEDSSENNGEDANNNEDSSENNSENGSNNGNSNGKETVINNIDQVNFVSEKSYAYLGATQTKFPSQEDVKNKQIQINAVKQEEYDAKWKDGQFIIKMPKEFINVSINNVTVNNSNVEILGHTVYEKEGNYYIKIITQNTNPETYNITIDYNAVINPRTTTSTNNLSLWYYNELADDYYYTAKDYYDINSNNQTNDNVGFVGMQCEFLAPTGIISFETVTEYNGKQEETIAPNKAEIDKNVKQAKINVELINNYKNAVSNIEILGKIPFEGNKFTINQSNMGSDFTTTMTEEGISIPEEIKQYTKIYYSENENPSKDINDEQNGWKLAEDVENFDNIKTYLITINNYNVDSGKKYKFSYKINIPENLEYNQTAYSSHAIYYELNTSEGKLKDYLEVSKVGIRVARKYNFDVYKYKEGTTLPVSGSTYELLEQNAEGEIINCNLLTTTQEGRMYLEGLYVDSVYTFKEIMASADYKINNDEIQFKVEESEAGELELTIISEDNFANTAILEKDGNGKETLKAKVEDEPKYEVIITNRDEETSKVITDLMVNANSNFYFTDQNGIITIPGLEQNAQYTLSQLRSKEYYLNEDINFKLYKDNEGNLKIESNSENFTNARIENSDNQNLIKVYVNTTNEKIPTYNLEIIKTEEKTDKKLSGAKFKVSSVDLQTKGYYTTENEGNIILNGLYKYVEGKKITGEYEIEEVIAPKGYCLNSEKIKFKAVQGEDGLNLEIENRTDLQTLEDVQIEGNTIKLILKDKPLFKLIKKDAETGEPLSNAKFIIYELNENNEMVDYAKDANGNYIAEKTNYTVTTDENGEIRLPLRAGKYKTIEVGYPENYEEKGGTGYFEVEDTNKEEEETEEEISETDAFTYDEDLQIDEVYEINYIEELLKYYKSSNPTYSDVVLKLQRTLDFNEDDSYLNKDDTSYGDLNGDGAVEGVKEELTKKSGTGMPQIRIYQGEFDGQGHELRNIYINSSSPNVSVFDSDTTTVLIKNLGITGEINATYEGTNRGTYSIGAFSSKSIGSIVNCYNKANINVNVNETNEDNLASFFIGGIVGAAGTISIKNSYNEGNITFSGDFGYHYIGGITGGTAGGTPGLKIENAYNKGNIEVNKVISETTKTIIGMIGGIVGGSYSSTIKNSYNIGNINTNHNNSMIGPIAGYNSQNTINSFYLETIEVTGGNINDVGTAKSEEEMKSDEFVSELGFYWKKYTNENNEYPMLNKEYEGIVINYIEDLVELSKDTNASRLTGSYYYRVPINLNRTLNFEDDSSYKNPTDTSYGDLNGNGEIEDIKTELTNKNGIGFIPIGGYDFCPIIDGHGYEIQNVYINRDAENIALISQMGKGEIKNLGITGEIKSYNNSARLAGILAYNSGFGFYRSGSLVIENCYNKANLSGNAGNVGGILGYSDYSILRIKCCHNEGNISIAKNTSSNIGGIIGYNELRSSEEALSGIIKSYNKGAISAEAGSIGGIAGKANISLLECYNESNIQNSNADYIGGLIGYTHQDASSIKPTPTIYKSYNKGSINSNIKGNYIAGIIGCGWSKAILGSYNEGNIITDGDHSYVGGIIGYGWSQTIDKCYNKGKIQINSANELGGLCGYIYGCISKISYSYNLGDITTNSSTLGYGIGGIAGSIGYDQAISLYNEGNISVKYGRQIGGIFGYKSSGYSTELINNGNIDVVSNAQASIGGIIGEIASYNGISKAVQNKGHINVFSNASVSVGGIIGIGSEKIINAANIGNLNVNSTDCEVAGISISDNNNKINNSYNQGNINVKYSGNSALIAGIDSTAKVTSCYNEGDIYAESINGYTNLGGITARLNEVVDCYNKGNIKVIGNGQVGGITGSNGYIFNAYNAGNIDAENCMIHTSGTMSNSYYLDTANINGNINSSSGNQKTQFVSDEYMKSEEFYNTLNTNNVWIKCQDNYPILNVAIPSNISKATEIEIENKIKKYEISTKIVDIGGRVEGTSETVKIGESNKNEFKFIPDKNYEIEYVSINGINQELNADEEGTYIVKPGDISDIREDKIIEVKFKYNPVYNLTIKKVDTDNENITLQGSKFEIAKKNDTTSNKVTVTTDANGIAKAILENDVIYVIKEIEPSIGYEKDESEQEVIIPSKEFRELTFRNKKTAGNITITKVDNENNDKKLPGAEFEITSQTDNRIAKLITNEEGIAQIYLEEGSYTLTETKAPDGYELNSNPETIVKDAEDISITIENTAITHQITSRVDGIGGAIEGEDETVKRYSDSTNDIIVKPDEGYLIKYIKVNGKTIDFDNTSNELVLDKFINVQEDIEIVAKFVEKNDYNFVLNKLDNITKEPLQNVKFEILDEDGNYARDYWGEIVGEKETINGQDKYIVTTDENGQIKLKLKIGKYKAVEISNTFNFILEEKEFEITNENIEYELSWMVTSVSFCNPNTAHIIGTKDGGMLTYVTNKTIPKDDVLAGEEILVTNNEMCIAKYNKYGKVEKNIKVNTQICYFDGMYEDNDGNYIIVGSAFKMDFTEEQTVENKRINFISTYGPPRFFILKLNKDLKFIWGIQSDNFYTAGNLAYISQNKDNYYNIGVIGNSLASSIIIPADQTEDNQEINIPQSGPSNLLIKCNSEGKIKSINKTSGTPITDIKENLDGTYTAIDGRTVFEYDANLQILSMNGVPTYGKTNKMIKLEDGGLLVPGKNVTENTIIPSNLTQSGEQIELNVNDTPSALLTKYNQEQKIIWAKSYDFSENADDEEEILSIKRDVNERYIGLVKIGSTYKLIKFDKDGNIIRIVDLPDSITPYLYTNKDNTQFLVYNNDNIYSYKLGNKDTKIKELYITNQKESVVNVHHYIKPTDKEGNYDLTKIAEDEKIIGKLGDEYTTKPKFDIEGYTLATDEEGNYEIPENASGTLKENNDDVNYYYEKVKSKLTIHYYLEGTESKIKEDKIQFCERGSQYEINLADEKIDHYVYVSSSTKLEDTIEKDTEVSLYYKKEQYKIITKVAEIEGKIEKGGNITGEDQEVYEVVEYENKINSEIKATPIAGYRLRALTINGNTAEYEKAEDGSALLNEQAPVTEDLEVVAQFEKNTGRVVVHHYIENTTQSIYDNTIFVDEVGKTIKVEPQEIEGYGLVERPQNEQIEITEGVQEVTYYYQQKIYIRTNVKKHNEAYKDGTIKKNQAGGSITGEENEYCEELLKGRTNKKRIEISPDEGYKIIKITMNSQNYDFSNKLDEEGNIVIEPEELGILEEDQAIEVEFRKKTKLYVKHIDKDTGNSLLDQEYEELELYESQTISINPKIIVNYQNAVPTLTDEFDKEISNEFEMFADDYTVTFWYERIPSGVVERHIEIDEKGNTTQLEMKQTDGKAGLNITITRKEYDKYVPVDAPKNETIENVTTMAKDENSVNIEYAPDEVKEVWFYYQRLCTISTQVKAHEGIETTKEGEIYQILIKEDGAEEKVNSEEVLRGQNAKNNIKVVPNQGYRIKEITLKKVIYNGLKNDSETDNELETNNAESEEIINNYFALYIEKTNNQEGNTDKERSKEEENQEDSSNKESISEDIIFNEIVTEEQLRLSEFINEQGEAIISIESEYLKDIDGDYTFTVEFERIPAVINIDYIDIDIQENVKESENINVFIGDNISKILEEKMNNIEGYKLTETVPEELPENATQEQLIIKLYYKKLFKITANQNIKEAGSIEFVDGSNEEIIQRGNENTKRIIIKTNYGYRIKNIKVNDKEIKIENLEKEENNFIIKEGYFKDVQEDKNVVVEFEKSPAIIKIQYIEYSSNKVIYKTPEGKEYEELNGYIGEEYKTEPKEIKGYELIQTKLPENASGKMTEEEIIVTYYYKKAEVKEDDKKEEQDDKKDELENKEDETEKDDLDNKENTADKEYPKKEENDKLEGINKVPFENIKTGDKIIVYVATAIITFIALGINFIISKKIKKTKEKNK